MLAALGPHCVLRRGGGKRGEGERRERGGRGEKGKRRGAQKGRREARRGNEVEEKRKRG